jgi:hypothetical protein
MRPELHFRAGSVTKSFVATAVLRLVAEGRLALSDTLERRLPGGIPAFLNIVLGTQDGRRQLGVMVDLLIAPDPVYEGFMRVVRELSSIRPDVACQA